MFLLSLISLLLLLKNFLFVAAFNIRHLLVGRSCHVISRVLENITGYIINIDDINYYKDEEGKYDYDRYVSETFNCLQSFQPNADFITNLCIFL